MTIEEVRTELNLRFERLKKHDKPMEHAYYMGAKFKGKCHWCGKIGHKSVECRQRITGKPKYEENNLNHKNQQNKNNNNSSYNNNNGNTNNNNSNKRKELFCSYCHKKGHEINECRKKKREDGGQLNSHMVKELVVS
jgi:hypothetical protein